MIHNTKTSGPRTKTQNQRQLRVGEELRHGLARILVRGGLRDPALLNLNLTVTEVRMSPDLKNATAFVVPLGGDALEETVAALNHAAGYFRTQLSQEVRLRHAPRVSFEADRSFDRAAHVEEILVRPHVRQDLGVREDLGPAPDAAEEEDQGGAGGGDEHGA